MSGEGKLKVYTKEEIEEKLRALPGWQYQEGFLVKEYTTKNWRETTFLFNAIAGLSEAQWHHPDLEVSYKKLKVKLITHEAGGITDRDFELAQEIERVVSLLAKRWYNIQA